MTRIRRPFTRVKDPVNRCDASAAFGTVLWVLLVALGLPGDRTAVLIETVLLFAMLVLVPLALPLVATPRRDGSHHLTFRLASASQPVGAVLVAVSAFLAGSSSNEWLAAALVTPWLGVTVLLAAFGCWRLAPRGLAPAEETLLDAGLLFLPVGALALVATRLELGLGFGATIVHLTAVHFHYATFLLAVVGAMVGRSLDASPSPLNPRRAFRPVAAVLVVGVPAVALGITFSRALEAVAATVLAAAVVGLAGLLVWAALDARHEDRLAAVLLVVAACSLATAMVPAVAYAWGRWVGPSVIAIPGMVQTHGLLNAFGFALLALLAWRRLAPASRVRSPGIPFSPLRARLRVGPDYPKRHGIAGETVSGQVDDVAAYARPPPAETETRTATDGFDPTALDRRVGRFYEQTGEYDLTYRARWHRPFRLGTRLAAAITHRIEQLALPVDGEAHGMDGELVTFDGSSRATPTDPRENIRLWVRTDPETGRGVFVAAYSLHEHDGRTYVNVGMPLPWSNLTAVLRPEHATDGGLLLTAGGSPDCDAGLYLVTPFGPVSLPIHEEFRVWPADAPSAAASSVATSETASTAPELVATHEMWLLGRQFLTIEYAIGQKAHQKAFRSAQTSTSTS